MKKNITPKALSLALTMIVSTTLIAQVKDAESNSAKIDSVYSLQKKIYKEVKDEPLAGKKFGIEINLIRLLMTNKQFSFSGSFSLFDVNRNSEIAFPFFLQTKKAPTDLSLFTADCHYRYFLGKYQKGFYLSAFVRYAYLNGTLGNNEALFDPNIPLVNSRIDSQSKLGVGLGLGYRIFSSRGLYWGTSLSMGRYILGKNDRFSGTFLEIDNDNEVIIDVEILKFGWAF